MNYALERFAHHLRTTCWPLAAAAAIVGLNAPANATNYDEAVSGDLSSDNTQPTNIGNLTAGNNLISGATIPSGPVVDPNTGAREFQDNDYLEFTVPTGVELSALIVQSGTSIVENDRLFMGIASGEGVYVPADFSSASGMLGWTLVSNEMIGTDVLDDLGASAPANFPAIPGATTFSGPLGAGTYTLWLLDGDSPVTYKLNLLASPTPEPSSWMMMLAGFGLVGSAYRHRPIRHAPQAA